jgi:hypothetical protein
VATVWQTLLDPNSGKEYYYNPTTQATQWHPPPELATSAA